MLEKSVEILHAVGLHARPATIFVQTAGRFVSSIRIEKAGSEVNAKSILSILSLGVKQGDVISICADGVDEMEALTTLIELVNSNFGEA
ncbi:MAG: HPr family phosphocarrier protein [Chloroflexi bacterium]|nr:HPr family phosphocarrier protein [Chloroflexota bacterium]